MLRKNNLFRKPLIRLVRLKMFEWVMLTVILANCVTLTMQSNKPGFDQSSLGRALAISDVVFISIFIFEAACKIIALGFVLDEHTYLRSGEEKELPTHQKIYKRIHVLLMTVSQMPSFSI